MQQLTIGQVLSMAGNIPEAYVSVLGKNVLGRDLAAQDPLEPMTGGDALVIWTYDWLRGKDILGTGASGRDKVGSGRADVLRLRLLHDMVDELRLLGDWLAKLLAEEKSQQEILESLPEILLTFLDTVYVLLSGRDLAWDVAKMENVPLPDRYMEHESRNINLTTIFYTRNLYARKAQSIPVDPSKIRIGG